MSALDGSRLDRGSPISGMECPTSIVWLAGAS
jgi:hypothetical protein